MTPAGSRLQFLKYLSDRSPVIFVVSSFLKYDFRRGDGLSKID